MIKKETVVMRARCVRMGERKRGVGENDRERMTTRVKRVMGRAAEHIFSVGRIYWV